MPQPKLDLRRSWLRAWHGIGAESDGDETFVALAACYAEPQRQYHTLQHLGECIAWFESVPALAQQPGEVELALWFHDAVYDVRRSDNEACSAEWAGKALQQAGVASQVAGRVHALVLATTHAHVPDTPDAQLLVDIDLAILGAKPQRFAEYERQIREEYAHVPDEQFRRRRRAILRSFLDRPRIYGTPYFHDRLDAAARANLRAAIE